MLSFKCGCTMVKTQGCIGVSLESLKALEEKLLSESFECGCTMVKTQVLSGMSLVSLKTLEE